MIGKLGILFLHHDFNEVARQNLGMLAKYNPDALITTMSGGVALPGGYSIGGTPQLQQFHAKNTKRSSDWLVCSWFVQRKEQAEKWWIVEWDTFCRISAWSYYRPVWDFPFVASSVKLPYREPGWPWFNSRNMLPGSYLKHLTGAVPFLYLMSESALSATCSMLLTDPLFVGNGELRFTTAANRAGFPPCGFSPPKDHITWRRWKTVPSEAGIFHPVKHLVGDAPIN